MKTITTSLVFTIILFLSPFLGQTQVIADDRLALEELYNSTGGPGWTNSWVLSDPVSTWYGVTVTGDRVTHLSLPNNNLTGTIPTQLGDLDQLIHLYLNKNNLTGQIPVSFGDLTALEQLSLKDNDLSGTIPSSLGNLPNLTNLILQKNDLTGSIPGSIGNLTNLTHLYLSQNNLSGAIPSSIGTLTSLTNLSFSQNQLSGNIPVELGALVNLKYCYLNVNDLTGNIPPELGDLSNLIQLSLNKNELDGVIPATLGDLSNLKFLHLQDNNLTGTIPFELGDLSSLKQLYLQTNQLEGEIPVELGDLSSLTHLSLSTNKLTGIIPEDLGDLSNLTHLYLNNNQLGGTIPGDLGDLSNLKYLSLSENKLKGNIPTNLGNLSNIIQLLLNKNKLNGTIPTQFASLSNLTHLYLHYNLLNGDIPNLSNANIVYVHYNRFAHEDIALNHSSNSSIGTYTFSPQYYGQEQHLGNPEGSAVDLEPDPAIPYTSPSVRWRKDGSFVTGSYVLNDIVYEIPSLSSTDVGQYEYWFYDYTLSPTVQFRSLPINNYIDGEDLEGEPIITEELIIDFTDVDPADIPAEETKLGDLGGTIKDECGCDSKLKLYKFPGKDILSILETLGKTESSGEPSGPDGGFNRLQSALVSPTGDDKYLPKFFTSGIFTDNVVVAYLDTGMDITHPAVSTKLWTNPESTDTENCYTGDFLGHGYNFVDDNGDVTDEHGHGTSVGGLIAENIPDGAMIEVMPIKVYGEDEGTLFNLGCGIHYAIDNNADLINISLGYKGEESSMLKNAFLRAKEEGIITCVSAGNEGINIDETAYWPAGFAHADFNLPNVLTIGAIGDIESTTSPGLYEYWEDSNYGPNTVNFAVRGHGLITPAIGDYGDLTGTSASAPLAALTLAINMSIEKDRTYEDILDELDGQLDADVPEYGTYVKDGKYLDIELTEDFIYLSLKVLLEGALTTPTSNEMKTTLNDLDLLPIVAGEIAHPYCVTGDKWAGVTEYDADVVDWVLVSIRQTITSPSSSTYTVPALLLKDGTIRMPGPIKDDELNFPTYSNFYIVVQHRNHLPVATHEMVPIGGNIQYDFTEQDSYTPPFGQKEITPGAPEIPFWVMYSGNVATTPGHPEDINGDDIAKYTGDSGVGAADYYDSDANLDGYVDSDDWVLIDLNFGISTSVTNE